MSSVSRISGSGGVSRTQGPGANNLNPPAGFQVSFHENFEFPHKRLTIKEEYNTAVEPRERQFYWVLVKLFIEVLECRIDIVPTQPRDAGGYAVEAFFRPPNGTGTRPAIHVPLPIKALTTKPLRVPSSGGKLPAAFVVSIEEYIEKVVSNFTDEQVLRLIIVMAHEYGHYQSFVRGNHDQNLKKGLYIFQKKYLNSAKADQYTWLVFREECQAWNYAEIFLRKTDFSVWDTYEEVKNGSLKTYFDKLNLVHASLETYYSLSFLGEDFKKNSSSDFFVKQQLLNKKQMSLSST